MIALTVLVVVVEIIVVTASVVLALVEHHTDRAAHGALLAWQEMEWISSNGGNAGKILLSHISIHVLEGNMTDLCKGGVFEATYEAVEVNP